MPNNYSAFSNSQVYVVAPNHPELAVVSSSQVRFEQAEDSPIYLVIGPYAADDQLQRASDRFGVDLKDLKDFRDNQNSVFRQTTLLTDSGPESLSVGYPNYDAVRLKARMRVETDPNIIEINLTQKEMVFAPECC